MTTTLTFACLVVVFAATSFVSVVTGGTSLITVPVMIQLGIEPHVAVATNMFSLVFLSLGGTVPFLRADLIPRARLPMLLGLTLAGSILGAFLLLIVPTRSMPLIVALAMISVVGFTLTRQTAGVEPVRANLSPASLWTGYLLTFLLGIYGGFFSGGYIAFLTAVCVAFLGMTYLEAVGLTKVLNLSSSLVATIVFASRGLIDWKHGLSLSLVSFAGASLGAIVARRMSNLLLRRIFQITVVALALKTICFDLY